MVIILPLFFVILRALFKCMFCSFLCEKRKEEEQKTLLVNTQQSNKNSSPTQEENTNQKTRKQFDFKTVLSLSWIFLKLFTIIIPSIFVICIQSWCIYHFNDFEYTIYHDDLFTLKYLISFVFVFLIGTQCSKILNALLLLSITVYTKLPPHWVKIPFVSVILIPYLIAFGICWMIGYYTVLYLLSQESLIAVIQSFAGFFVLMEFSKIMTFFLKSINFEWFFNKLVDDPNTMFVITVNILNH